jgi:DNA-binding CsgD family transcriptional regulator
MAGCEYIKFIPKLTKRELEVIESVLAGALRYKSIASSLNISVNTVKTHLRKIYLTVGVNNTETLASLFHGYSPNKTGITPNSPLKNKKSPQIGDRKQHCFAVIFYNIMHSGGKKMQNLKALRTRTVIAISLVLVIALVTGFVAVKLVSGNSQTNVDFGITAESAHDGILLTFNDIPSDTARLWIGVENKISDNEPENHYNILYSYSDLRNNSLEQVKQAKKVILPIVQTGQNYTITVMFQNEKFADIVDWVYADCVAGNGIYFDYDNVQFEMSKTHSAVTISSEPIFSSEVTFAPRKYSFAVTVFESVTEDGAKSVGIGEHQYPSGLTSDGLTWSFEPYFTDILKADNYLETGNYSAFGTAYCNIIYDDIKWTIEIAKSPEFTYSL